MNKKANRVLKLLAKHNKRKFTKKEIKERLMREAKASVDIETIKFVLALRKNLRKLYGESTKT